MDQGAPSASRLVAYKFSGEIVLVRCKCAFRLRRLAQSLRREFFRALRHVFFSGKIYLNIAYNNSSEMSMCIAIAQARAKVVAMPLGRGIFPARSEENKIALLRCPHAFRLRILAQSGCCASGARHSSHKFSHQTTPRGFRLRRLAQSVEAASSGDLGEALSTRSLHTTSRSSYDLVQILVGRPCGVLVEFLWGPL